MRDGKMVKACYGRRHRFYDCGRENRPGGGRCQGIKQRDGLSCRVDRGEKTSTGRCQGSDAEANAIAGVIVSASSSTR